ncbi:MAG: 2-C-methyl-D-erythritol 2,4-cyclodiphosphate synthase [Planctomycetes bacterium]|nr:2-C-methyl-D-erythritol 2,4-cyclodiphosphate synthase [Planctomycetota bacterium]
MGCPYRIGYGNDLHRLAPGKPLVLGGVRIEHSLGPEAHSDGDVLLHATVDALLGAAALGDIGELFPDTDVRYRGMDSSIFVRRSIELLRDRGWRPVNVDAVVLAQAPRLGPYKTAIRQHLAEMLGLGVEQVSVKAKTGEKVGPIGLQEAIGAEVVVLIEPTGPAA